MLPGFRLSLISLALYCLGILTTEKLHGIFLMEMGASFGEWRRSTSHVLSFSTSVLLFRGVAMQISLPFGYRCFVRKEKWSCFGDRLSVVPPPTPHPPSHPLVLSFLLIFFFFLIFYLELGCQEKGMKNQQRGSIRSSSVCEVSLSSIWRKASEWRRNETKLFPVTFDPASSKSPWSGGRGTGVPWLGVTDTSLWPSVCTHVLWNLACFH